MEQPKPCPFCGMQYDRADTENLPHGHHEYYWLHPDNPECHLDGDGFCDNPEYIARFNRRVLWEVTRGMAELIANRVHHGQWADLAYPNRAKSMVEALGGKVVDP